LFGIYSKQDENKPVKFEHQAKTLSKKSLGSQSYNGEIHELDLLNSRVRRGYFKNKLEKVFGIAKL